MDCEGFPSGSLFFPGDIQCGPTYFGCPEIPFDPKTKKEKTSPIPRRQAEAMRAIRQVIKWHVIQNDRQQAGRTARQNPLPAPSFRDEECGLWSPCRRLLDCSGMWPLGSPAPLVYTLRQRRSSSPYFAVRRIQYSKCLLIDTYSDNVADCFRERISACICLGQRYLQITLSTIWWTCGNLVDQFSSIRSLHISIRTSNCRSACQLDGKYIKCAKVRTTAHPE